MKNKHISQKITIFHGREAPEPGILVGYGAIIDYLKLPLPLPRRLALISHSRRQYKNGAWNILTPRHEPLDTLYGHLVFAIKYEGINLLFFKKLFEKLDEKTIIGLITASPFSIYARKIWFLYEWMMNKKLDIPDLKKGNYVPLLDDRLQFTNDKSINISRYKIRNNIPGNSDFAPLIDRTQKLEKYISEDLSNKMESVLNTIHKDLYQRIASFLLLKDSRASFNIEGETPPPDRALRWGQAIGEAGIRELNKDELLRLQRLVIEDSRFIKMGYRREGGFVGEHDPRSGFPIPVHISARSKDIEKLIQGLIDTSELLIKSQFHPVLTASLISFGFVLIHPFVDGNGRIHRYLIHHILAGTKFSAGGVIFPVSSAILDMINDYRKVLESFSIPLLSFIDWEKTLDNNINVLNDTIDYYRYFDATPFAEFLFDCVKLTIKKIIPEEVNYLRNFDQMKNWINTKFNMPDKTVTLLIKFLEQNDGSLSIRSRRKEFAKLTDAEVKAIEKNYKRIFLKK